MKYWIVFTAALIAFPCAAEPVFRPPGLEDGDQYRILFPTSRLVQARSSDIDFYNDFVQGVADRAPVIGDWGLEWKALVSTSEVSAADNTETQRDIPDIAIYRLDGKELVPSYGSLWVDHRGFLDSWRSEVRSWHLNDLMRPNPRFDFDSGNVGAFVWTGTNPTGDPLIGGVNNVNRALGSPEGDAAVGKSDTFGFETIRITTADIDGILPVYALSEVITVPEPSSVTLLLCICIRFRRRRG